jgi:NADH:ubiquinone oxidoreductase subunit E
MLSDKEGCSVAAREKSDAMLEAQEEFTAEQWAAVDAIIGKNKAKPGSLIPVLEEIQESIGYLPKSIQDRVAHGLRIPSGEVYGVVTFYSFFTMVPRGKHSIRCCLGTACYVRGGRKNIEKVVEALGVQPGETTRDRKFSLETVRCLGACALAPAMTVDGETYQQVKPSQIPTILRNHD